MPLRPPRAALADSPFLAACAGRTPRHTPVWFMRQAGRSLPEYRELREGKTFHETITDAEIAAEITLQPVRRHGVDAAIFFSDIITPIQAFVPGITIEAGRGPVIETRFRRAEDVGRLKGFTPIEHIPYVIEAVQRCVEELDPLGVPLIGFAGAPLTIATYLLEGGKSKEFESTKLMMYGDPDNFHALLDAIADISLATLRSQVRAGASAVQLFDSWAGILSEADYREFALPASRKVLEGIADLGVPRIHFGVGTGELLGAMADAGADVVGVDWRVPLTAARERVGAGPTLQGNLDPVVVLNTPEVIERQVRRVLDDAAAAGGGHIFNLGHGVLPQTKPEALTRIVEQVHAETER